MTKVSSGAIGGVIGGIVFGMMMAAMGMMPMIAKLIGSDSTGVGWIVHLIISAGTGAIFALIFGAKITSYGSGVGYGLLYGIIWWVLGALILMPVILGMGVQFAHMFEKTPMMSLMGHIIWGLILGAAYVALVDEDGKTK
jgi:uncharacterized membrane protein YagU involved in acid resistance